MASRTKGITIEINGDVTKLDDSLREVNKSLSEAGRGLKDVDRLLKLDPSNVDLLKQKQEYLNTSIEGTKEKLQREKEALEQMKNTEGFDKSSEAAKALERQIIADEEALKKFQDDVKDLPTPFQASMQEAGKKVEEVGSKIGEVGGKIKGAGETLTKGVTAPIAAVGAASVAAWKEVDEAMDTITTKTGASGEALADMQQRAKDIATTIPTDFQTAADAVGEVNTRFGLTGDALQNLSGDFVKFAQLNDTDVSSSIDSVQSAMAAWGIGAEDASLVLDTMNKAGQDTGISVDKLSDMLKTNKTALDEAGLSFSDSAMLLANMDKNGVDAGTALAGLKKALQNATKEGIPANVAMQQLQDKMSDGSNKAEAYAAATELFGAKAGPAIADACMEGRLSFDELGTSMQDFAGNVGSTFDETLDPMDQMQTNMNLMKELGADIVETAAPMIVEAMTAIRDAITTLKEKWDGLSEDQQQMIIKIAGIAAVVGPVLVVIATVVGAISTIVTAIGGVIGILGAPLLGPIALIVAAVMAAIAVGMLVADNWDYIKAKAKEFVDSVKEKWENFKENTVGKFNEIKEGAKEKFVDMVRDVLGRVIAIKDGVKEKFQDMKDSVEEKFGGIADKAQEIFDKVKKFIEDPVGTAKDFVKNAIEDIKGFFNFEWKLPELKLPHINVGAYIDVPALGTIPDPRYLTVDWYDTAMDKIRVLKGATIFGASGGKLLGGGESGREVVSGEDHLLDMFMRGVETVMQRVKGAMQTPASDTIQNAIRTLSQTAQRAGDSIRNFKYGDVSINIYPTDRQDAHEIAREVADILGDDMASAEAVYR